jgi:outer membrane protein assembly factor BamB
MSINPASKTAQNFTSPRVYTVTAEDGSSKNYFVTCTALQSDLKDITSFSFTRVNNPQLTADINATILNDSIIANMPFGTNITNLKPSITINGVSVLPASLMAQNFSTTVQYIVNAENGTSKVYKAVLTIEQNTGTLYINSSYGLFNGAGKIYVLDPNTGSLKWSYTATSTLLVSSIDYSNGILYTALEVRSPPLIRSQEMSGGNIQREVLCIQLLLCQMARFISIVMTAISMLLMRQPES